jgi:hypothetical protein
LPAHIVWLDLERPDSVLTWLKSRLGLAA